MLYEYAVEPTALGSDFDTFRAVVALFGVERGRFISQLPNEWLEWVMKAAEDSDLGEIKIKTIEDRLLKARPPMPIDAGRRWNPKLSGWLNNAISLHEEHPFQAILADCDASGVDILNIKEFVDSDPLMEIPISWEVPRTSDGISEALLPMAKLSRRIHIIDPYFDFRNRADNYKGPVQSLLSKLYALSFRDLEINIHYRNADARCPYTFLEDNKESLLSKVLPPSFKMLLHEWAERDGGPDFHDRYLITDIGGLTLGAGFGETNVNQMLNITRMSLDLAEIIEARHDRHTGAFDLVAPILCVDSDLNVTHL